MRSNWLLEGHSKVGLGWAYFMVSICFLSKLELILPLMARKDHITYWAHAGLYLD
jgi:hypothetical protein